MAQIAKSSKSTQKKEAYQKKQEEGGKKVLEYIFGALLILAVLFVVYSIFKRTGNRTQISCKKQRLQATGYQ